MTSAFEFHDTRLLEIECSPSGDGAILLHASVYRFDHTFPDGAYESGWQNVRLTLEGMKMNAVPPVGEILSEGTLSLDGNECTQAAFPATWGGGGMVPMPVALEGNVRLEMRISPDFEVTTIVARKLFAASEGQFEAEARWDAEGNVSKIA